MSRLFATYDYSRIVDKYWAVGMTGGMLLGAIVGSYSFTNPKYGIVRFRDGLFGGLLGAAAGSVAGCWAVLVHPTIVLVIPVSIAYVYNKYRDSTSQNGNVAGNA